MDRNFIWRWMDRDAMADVDYWLTDSVEALLTANSQAQSDFFAGSRHRNCLKPPLLPSYQDGRPLLTALQPDENPECVPPLRMERTGRCVPHGPRASVRGSGGLREGLSWFTCRRRFTLTRKRNRHRPGRPVPWSVGGRIFSRHAMMMTTVLRIRLCLVSEGKAASPPGLPARFAPCCRRTDVFPCMHNKP